MIKNLGKYLLGKSCKSCRKIWKDRRYSYNDGTKCSICKKYSCDDCTTYISEKIQICHSCNGNGKDKLWKDFYILNNLGKRKNWSHKKIIFEMTKIAIVKRLEYNA